ncbi:hypothetical protein [Tissierella creatinophila]|uniref:Uncharacterized protein n=1 Tax=Tissierella creatinophila DSM 6911 TaxID=1123403 RepID=A0A1U7M7U1_TISCR|nr:hypothetical protein [Tissierella creatinophila]OLS03356.1 hypothetical protein TICRE_05860 [Tissierella creatinophila DSM 6911]
MNGNKLLIDFSMFMIAVSFGSFILKYYKQGVWSLPHLAGALTGAIILIPSLFWRRKHKKIAESGTKKDEHH